MVTLYDLSGKVVFLDRREVGRDEAYIKDI